MLLSVCYTLNKRTYYPKIEVNKDWRDIHPKDVYDKIPKGAFLVGYCPNEYANMTLDEIKEWNDNFYKSEKGDINEN